MQFMSNPSEASEQAKDRPILTSSDDHPAMRLVNKAKKVNQRRSIAQDTLVNREYSQIHEQQPQRYDIHSYTRDLADVALAGTVTAGLVLPPALALSLALAHRYKTKNSGL